METPNLTDDTGCLLQDRGLQHLDSPDVTPDDGIGSKDSFTGEYWERMEKEVNRCQAASGGTEVR